MSILIDMKMTQPVTSPCIITFQKSFINLKRTEDITLKCPGLDVKHSLHTCKCNFIIICYTVSNLIGTHYTV